MRRRGRRKTEWSKWCRRYTKKREREGRERQGGKKERRKKVNTVSGVRGRSRRGVKGVSLAY